MFTHPDTMIMLAKHHVDELIEEASRQRLAASFRHTRRQRWPGLHRRSSRP